jgi:preprotein translocase subunit SecA
MKVEMIEPTEQPAPQPTQGVFMDNFQAPNLVGIIMQALEAHIEAMVDKRFNERMNDLKDPTLPEIKDIMTEMFDELLDEKLEEKISEAKDEIKQEIADTINDTIDEKISDHQSEYDHDEYDQCVRNVDEGWTDDLEEKIREVLRGSSFTINL